MLDSATAKAKPVAGYIPGAAYNGGLINQEPMAIDGNRIITSENHGRATYNTAYYRITK